MKIKKEIYSTLKEIVRRKPNGFSGIGLVIYDPDEFDSSCHCDLRPTYVLPKYNIKDSLCIDYLIGISDYQNTLHDGFHMFNKDGELTHVAQYFVPPARKDLLPNQEHGVRLYSSICGSTMDGVLFIAVISSNFEIDFFENGNYLDLNEMEE